MSNVDRITDFDQLKQVTRILHKENQVQRTLSYAIIDEVDSVLIDEARTPLIISGPAEESTGLYYDIDKLGKKLVEINNDEILLQTVKVHFANTRRII